MSLAYNKTILFGLIFLTLSFWILSTREVSAITAGLQESSVAVESTPKTPGPLEDITLKITSYSTDLNKATISWTVNNVLKLSGVGKISFTTKSADLGEETRIKIKITTSSGESVEKNISINPTEIDLLWESADGYTPPFYKGKALLLPEAQVKVTAIPWIKNPDGSFLKPENLIYSWERNLDSVLPASGFNKQSFIFKHSYFNESEFVGVSVSGRRGGGEATSQKSFKFDQKPLIIFYREAPFVGINYNVAVPSSIFTNEKNTTIVAEPYFVSAKNDYENKVDFLWKINGQSIGTPSIPQVLNLKTEGSGASNISLEVRSQSLIFQDKESSISLNVK